eukprot:SAG11_NODE_2006_length_3928_cov_7.941499_2_plen_91_part_00
MIHGVTGSYIDCRQPCLSTLESKPSCGGGSFSILPRLSASLFGLLHPSLVAAVVALLSSSDLGFSAALRSVRLAAATTAPATLLRIDISP